MPGLQNRVRDFIHITLLQQATIAISELAKIKEQNAKLIEAMEKIAHWYDNGESDFSGDTPTGYAADALKGIRDES